jgi:hypothetical protein
MNGSHSFWVAPLRFYSSHGEQFWEKPDLHNLGGFTVVQRGKSGTAGVTIRCIHAGLMAAF